jgi:GNAT superfamily N-acetyltransferase
MRAVTELVVLSFGDRLDPAGQMALQQMRLQVRRRAWTRWASWPRYDRPGISRSGFVWEEAGTVVGNVSLRPASQRGGFIIGNVCVHPDWRRRGIAAALMRSAIGEISRHGGRWVGLEVREENSSAQGLYQGLGFVEAGRTLRLLRLVGASPRVPHAHVPGITWRRGRRGDSSTLFRLAQAGIPRPLHVLLELRRADYEAGWERGIDRWLSGVREGWWVAVDAGVLCGAVRAVRRGRSSPDRLEVLVRAEHAAKLGRALGAKGLSSLRHLGSKVVETVLPVRRERLAEGLEELGFRRSHELVQMKLVLRSSPANRVVI